MGWPCLLCRRGFLLVCELPAYLGGVECSQLTPPTPSSLTCDAFFVVGDRPSVFPAVCGVVAYSVVCLFFGELVDWQDFTTCIKIITAYIGHEACFSE